MTALMRRKDPMLAPIDRLFDRVMREPFFGELSTIDEGTLALDVMDDGDNIIVKASLPGFKRDDVSVEISDGVLTINARHDETVEESDEHFYRRERRTGAVSRRIALPAAVEEEKADARLADGVLTLKLPKAGGARPKKISIK